jgi:hypothetical protein
MNRIIAPDHACYPIVVAPADRDFLRDFFRAVTDRPLDPDDPQYVPLYADPERAGEDPVELLARAIEWTPGESVQLLSGFRGTGKSTELRRLRKRLRNTGYRVVLCDFEDYLNMSTPVDITDFLIALAGAFGDGLLKQKLLDNDPSEESYWARAVAFLTRTEVGVSELSAQLKFGLGPSVGLKANLKSDPTFTQKLRERMAGHLGALVEDVRSYLQGCVRELKQRHGGDTEVVLLLDSIEHIRGTTINAAEVQASLETLFASHADKLRLPDLHVVYTVPPYLKVRYAALGALYAPGGVHVLPALKVRECGGGPVQGGLDALERVVRARGDWKRLLGERTRLDSIILTSGGHLRDLLRMLAELLRRATVLPVSDSTLEAAINQIRTESLPIADADAVWLARIAETHDASLTEVARLPDLARFLDTHLVLCYRNGGLEWYDAHPLIADEVRRQAAAVMKRARAARADPKASGA